MITDVSIGGSTVSHHILKDGVTSIRYEIEDEDGELTVPSAKIKLSNINGNFSSYIGQPIKKRIEIFAGAIFLFAGFQSSPGSSYDYDNCILNLDALSIENEYMCRLKTYNLSDLNFSGAIETWEVGRVGYKLNLEFVNIFKLLDLCLNKIGISSTNRFIDYFSYKIRWYTAFGGYTNRYDISLDGSLYDYISSLSKLINAVWWFDKYGRFYFYGKDRYIRARALEQPFNIIPLKDTLNISDKYSIYQQYQLYGKDYKSRASIWTDEVDGGRFIVNVYPNPFSIKKRELSFSIPRGRRSKPYVGIPAEESRGDYLIGTWLNSQTDYYAKFISTQDLWNWCYTVDFYTGESISGDFSLLELDNRLFLSSLPAVYKHVSILGKNKYFLRAIEVDLSNDVAHFDAVRYNI